MIKGLVYRFKTHGTLTDPLRTAQSAGTVEYTARSYKGVRSPNECLVYDIKPYDGKAPVML